MNHKAWVITFNLTMVWWELQNSSSSCFHTKQEMHIMSRLFWQIFLFWYIAVIKDFCARWIWLYDLVSKSQTKFESQSHTTLSCCYCAEVRVWAKDKFGLHFSPTARARPTETPPKCVCIKAALLRISDDPPAALALEVRSAEHYPEELLLSNYWTPQNSGKWKSGS